MTASAANGFMNTNIADCSGTPFTFHAEYSTAEQQNQVPWAALEGGVLMEQEIGHSEVCNSVTNQDPFTHDLPGRPVLQRPEHLRHLRGRHGRPERRPVRARVPSTACQNATTQGPNGPVACPTDNPASGALCEFADGYCFQKGSRTALVNGVPTTEYSDANQCFADRFQNGDLDFDGLSYLANSWPNGTKNHPTAFQYVGPFQANGQPYPQVQFESDIGGSSALCDTTTGSGCTVPPISAQFYPYWSLSPLVRRAGWPRDRVRVELRQGPAEHHQRISARTPSTARLTWRGTAARSSVRSSPIPSSPAAAASNR